MVLYYLPTLGSADPYVLLPTTTMIQLGRCAYAPARMEIVDDVINMTRMRGRADSNQLAPIQILTLRDPNPDGSGTPITAWTGRGATSGSVGDNMDTSDAGGDRYSTPNNSFTTSSYESQYPMCVGSGTSTTVQTTSTARGGGVVWYKERSTLLRLLHHHLRPLHYLTWGNYGSAGTGPSGDTTADPRESGARSAEPSHGRTTKRYAVANATTAGAAGAGGRG